MSRPSSSEQGEDSTQSGERLQKVLSRAGFGSRRACEQLILEGRVTVDGKTAAIGRRIDPSSARVEVDGVGISINPDLVYYLLNKPAGVVTSASDPEGRPTVLSLLPEEPRVFPVGRLDMATEGLLLLTNDGDLAQLVAHPSHGIKKEYLVEVEGVPSGSALSALRHGVELSDGMSAPARVGVLGRGILRIVIHEGRNRQVRRMCEAVGYPVRRLVRTRIGPVSDKSLQPGQWRELSARELRALTEMAAQGN